MLAFGGAVDMGPSLVHPAWRLRIANEVEQPAHQGDAVTTPEAEAPGVGSERVGECAGIVVGAADGVRHHLGDGFRALVAEEKIRRDAGGTRDEEAPKRDPLAAVQLAVVEAHVGAARLLPGRHDHARPDPRRYGASEGPMGARSSQHDHFVGVTVVPARSHTGRRADPATARDSRAGIEAAQEGIMSMRFSHIGRLIAGLVIAATVAACGGGGGGGPPAAIRLRRSRT